MTSTLLLGLDIGTSGSKAVVVGPDGAELSSARRVLTWTEVDGGAELSAAGLLQTVSEVTAEALASSPPGRVVAVGVASMAEAGFPLDVHGVPLAPAMAWHDDRAAGELDALVRDLDGFSDVTGLRITSRVPAVRLRWQLASRRLAEPPSRWLNVAEYVVHALGGEAVAEPSLASRTGWFDVGSQRWWDPSLTWSGVPRSALPELRDAGRPAGVAGDAVPWLAGATLTVAGHDHLVAAVGAGVLGPERIVNSCGTAEVMLRAVTPVPSAVVRRRAAALGFTTGRHVVPGHHALIGGYPSGSLLARAARALGFADEADADRHATASGSAAGVVPDGFDPTTLAGHVAALERDRPPPDDVAARQWLTCVDAVAARAAEVLAHLEQLTGPHEGIVTVGGSTTGGTLVAAARSRHLGELTRPSVGEAAARGAALVAGVAAEIYDGVLAVPAPAPTVGQEPA